MRVLCLTDNDLADGVVWNGMEDGWYSVGVDDIATPGSFWLNPPQPRDDDNNRIESIESYIEAFSMTTTNESMRDAKNGVPVSDEAVVAEEPSEEDLLRMLADIDSL